MRYSQLLQHIDPDKPVQVYRNLHKNCWSIRQQGKVKAHTPYVCLESVQLKVSEPGRQRVLREKRKNVHAYVVGYVVDPATVQGSRDPDRPEPENPQLSSWQAATYNPYKHATFVDADDGPIVHAEHADMLMGDTSPLLVLAASATATVREEYRGRWQAQVSDRAEELLDAKLAQGEAFTEGLCDWATARAHEEIPQP